MKGIYIKDEMLMMESMYPPSFVSWCFVCLFPFYKTHMHASLHFPSHVQQTRELHKSGVKGRKEGRKKERIIKQHIIMGMKRN
jgi:hypothetical protein